MKTQSNRRVGWRRQLGLAALLVTGMGIAQAGPWQLTGSLHAARDAHTATLLTNSLVLVTGGYTSAGVTNGVEIYASGSGTWQVGTPMGAPRYEDTATLLPNGKVLVAGGFHYDSHLRSYIPTNSAELYDPQSGTWTNTGVLNVARGDHTAILLPNGKVMVCGGDNGTVVTGTTEWYDPSSGTWTLKSPMPIPTTFHTATLMLNGKILATGGRGADLNGTNCAQVYDPAADSWSVTAPMSAARYWHAAVLLKSGQVLVAAGETDAGYVATAELYDPSSETWSATGSLATARGFHTLTLLANGQALVAGGANNIGTLSSAEVFDPGTGTWRSAGTMSAPRSGHSATLLNGGQLLVAGGSGSAGFIASSELYTPPVFSDSGLALPGVFQASIAWGDYDGDARLDFALSGVDTNQAPVAPLWRNTGSMFTNDTSIPFAGANPGVTWGDFNNDGRLDFLANNNGLRQNTGSGFTLLSIGLPAAYYGSVAFGDYDNDGRPDILLSGYTQVVKYDSFGIAYLQAQMLPHMLWHNTVDGFIPVLTSPPAAYYGTVSWGDYDNDGRLDMLLTGINTNGVPVTQIWRNTGSGFTNINAGLPGVAYGTAAWGDYDNDGRLDILLCGATVLNHPGALFDSDLGPYELKDDSTPVSGVPSGFITQVWRNTGNGFSNINAGLPGLWAGSAAWGDYDNDGRLDILLSGATGSFVVVTPNNDLFNTSNYQAFANGFVSQVWHNTGAEFADINAGLPGVGYGAAAWGDYDHDGRLDILLAGAASVDSTGIVTAAISQLLHNDGAGPNTPPGAPSGLQATLAGSSVVFGWSAASDAQTPSSGLSYNLRVGTAPGAGDLVGPLAANNGFRRVPQLAVTQSNRSRIVAGLPLGQPIYWSVQAVDTAFAGSAFAPEQTFTFQTVFTPPNGVPVPGDLNGDGIVDGNELNAVLTNYWPYSPWLYLTNLAGLGGTNVAFSLTNLVSGGFSVQYTTNFSDWYYLGPATPRYLFTDTNAPAAPQRYYRLRWP